MPVEDDPLSVPDGIAGARFATETRTLSARWAMAFAAAVGENGAAFFDTTGAGSLAVHPLFPVCYEWRAWRSLIASVLPDDIAKRGVHTAHEQIRHRRIPVGKRLWVIAELESVLPGERGVSFRARLEARDGDNRRITTTRVEWFCAGVSGQRQSSDARVAGRLAPDRTRPGDGESPAWSESIDVAIGAAHVYTECARIFNPIHTDLAVARSVGLEAPILHGTATLAMSLSVALRRTRGDPFAYGAGLRAAFTKPVQPAETLSIEGYSSSDAHSVVVRRDRDRKAVVHAQVW